MFVDRRKVVTLKYMHPNIMIRSNSEKRFLITPRIIVFNFIFHYDASRFLKVYGMGRTGMSFW